MNVRQLSVLLSVGLASACSTKAASPIEDKAVGTSDDSALETGTETATVVATVADLKPTGDVVETTQEELPPPPPMPARGGLEIEKVTMNQGIEIEVAEAEAVSVSMIETGESCVTAKVCFADTGDCLQIGQGVRFLDV